MWAGCTAAPFPSRLLSQGRVSLPGDAGSVTHVPCSAGQRRQPAAPCSPAGGGRAPAARLPRQDPAALRQDAGMPQLPLRRAVEQNAASHVPDNPGCEDPGALHGCRHKRRAAQLHQGDSKRTAALSSVCVCCKAKGGRDRPRCCGMCSARFLLWPALAQSRGQCRADHTAPDESCRTSLH